MGLYLVERYGVDLSVDQVAAEVAQIVAAGQVAHVLSVIVPEDEGSLCVFEAATAGDVRRAAGAAGIVAERIVEVALDGPEISTRARDQRPERSGRQ